MGRLKKACGGCGDSQREDGCVGVGQGVWDRSHSDFRNGGIVLKATVGWLASPKANAVPEVRELAVQSDVQRKTYPRTRWPTFNLST